MASSHFKRSGSFCAQSVMSCSSTNGASECQVPEKKATSTEAFLPDAYPPSTIMQLIFLLFCFSLLSDYSELGVTVVSLL